MPVDQRPLLIRLDEAMTFNVDNRIRENLCGEAAAALRRLISVTDRLATKALAVSDPQASPPAAESEDWNQLYWLAIDAQAAASGLKRDA